MSTIIRGSGDTTFGGTIQSTGIDDNATSTAITIDASENVGIGVVPESWRSDYRNLAIGGTGVLWSQTTVGTGKAMGIGQNLYFDGTNKYITTDEASRYYQANGVHTFDVAPSGTADTAISWTNALQITNDGRGLSQFTAKAWVNFNGTGTVAINDSHNVSSITDTGTGQYYINFANALANANHASTATPRYVNGSGVALTSFWDNAGSTTRTPLLVVAAVNAAWSPRDSALINVITFGD